MIGQRLGPYEVLAKLGEGGMGEVYRARDARLGRDVAVKVLPSNVSGDPERLRRFEQEARAAGGLNHPNILAIHDIGTHDGAPFVVSELLEGQTLRDRLSGGALSVRRTTDYALQLASGLAIAHEKGIVHRDLKPENIFITADERVKILDFGLAKLLEPASDAGAPTELVAPRVNTDPGTVMGTVGYMSPEQVRGQPADHRSDIFSMGAVLHEMLSGTRLFRGDSAVETMHAILKLDPPAIVASGQAIPPGLQRVVDHCLEKSPAQRFQSARDLAFALEALSGSTMSGDVASVRGAVPSARSTTRERVAWVAAGVATLGLVAMTVALLRRPTVAAAAIRFSVPLPDKVSLSWGVQSTNLSVSPDGRQLVFVGITEGRRQLWARPFDQLVARALPDTEGASSPFWSPDGRYIAFFAGGKLKRIDPTGTSAQTICDLPGEIESTGTWGRDGVILFTVLNNSAQSLFKVDAAGGTATPFVKEGLWWPHFLPDGRHYLSYQWNQDPAKQGIVVASLDSSDTTIVVPAKMTRAEYSSGFIVYARDGSLVAQRFDESTLQAAGETITVVEKVPMFANTGWSGFSLSRGAVLMYVSWDSNPSRLVWRDRTGRDAGQVGNAGAWEPRISPDGGRMAVVQGDSSRISGEIWIHELARGTSTRFALGPTDNGSPVWSPDGKRLAFFSCCQPAAAVESTLRVKDVGDLGRGFALAAPGFHVPTDWSRDGRFILFDRFESSNKPADIWVLSVEERMTMAFLQTPFRESEARFSPDGRWVAYSSNETNRDEIYVARFDRPSEKSRVSIDGGRSPRWRRDGRELFFLGADNSVMMAAVKGRDSLEFEAPVALFRSESPVTIGWDADPGGQRFIVGSAAAAMPFAVVVNWTADLKR